MSEKKKNHLTYAAPDWIWFRLNEKKKQDGMAKNTIISLALLELFKREDREARESSA